MSRHIIRVIVLNTVVSKYNILLSNKEEGLKIEK
jgi:hypothetical protein